jgi:hypothetical protein
MLHNIPYNSSARRLREGFLELKGYLIKDTEYIRSAVLN